MLKLVVQRTTQWVTPQSNLKVFSNLFFWWCKHALCSILLLLNKKSQPEVKHFKYVRRTPTFADCNFPLLFFCLRKNKLRFVTTKKYVFSWNLKCFKSSAEFLDLASMRAITNCIRSHSPWKEPEELKIPKSWTTDRCTVRTKTHWL